MSLPLMADEQSSATVQEADAFFQAQKWAEAAKAYEAVSKVEPANARIWYRLGMSLHSLGKYEQALAALQKSVDIGGRPQAMYGLASTYARLNDKDRALEWLNKALKANLPQPRQIGSDPNLASLRGDARFKETLALAEKAAKVCLNIPEYRQFDFWVGEWSVQSGGQEVGTNSVRLIEDGCIIEENWTSGGGSGQTGKSYNFYNPVTRKWHQSYMGNDGGNWMMDGEYKEGALRYEGAIFTPNGNKTLVHMTFFNLGPDKVRQMAETSSDNGKTWAVTWDAMYIRKK
jgi:tetratricopeptide (TPR) repeat protein